MGNNQLSVTQKDNIFIKIKDFFSKIFKSKKDKNIKEITTEKIQKQDKNFLQNLNSQTNTEELDKQNKIIEIVNIIEQDSKLLNNVSAEKLKVISKYYDNKIKELDKRIGQLEKLAN